MCHGQWNIFIFWRETLSPENKGAQPSIDGEDAEISHFGLLALHKLGYFTIITLVCHNTLIWIQMMHEALPKDNYILELTSWVGDLNPDQVALQNIEANCALQCQLPLVLEGCKTITFCKSSLLEDV